MQDDKFVLEGTSAIVQAAMTTIRHRNAEAIAANRRV